MILNPNLNKAALDANKDTILRGIAEGAPYNILTLFSSSSHIPIVAVLAYAIRPDIGGPNPDIQQILDFNNNTHYRYESIVPWTDLP